MGTGCGGKGLRTRICFPLSTTIQQNKMDDNRPRRRERLRSRVVGNVKEKGHRGSGPQLPGVLLHVLPGSKKRRRLAPRPELETSKQVHEVYQVQDGDQRLNISSSVPRGLAGKPGPKRCIFSCSSLASPQAVPEVCIQRPNFSIQSPPIRTYHSPSSVHDDLGSHCGSHTPRRHQIPPIFRRLPGHCTLEDSPIEACSEGDPDTPKCRFSYQLEKICTGTLPRFEVSRDEVSHRPRDGPITRRPGICFSKVCRSLYSTFEAASQDVPSTPRFDGSLRQGGPSSSLDDEAPPAVCAVSVECDLAESRPQADSDNVFVTSPSFLQGHSQPYSGSTPTRSSPDRHSDDRCVVYGVGGVHRQRLQSAGALEAGTSKPAHQLFGVNSGNENPRCIRPPFERQSSPATNRQCGHQAVHQQLGGDSIPIPLCPSTQVATLVSSEQHHAASRACARQGQRISGLPVADYTVSDRVVAQSEGCPGIVQHLGRTTDRSICHCREQENPDILQLAARLSGLPCRCTDNVMGRPVGLRVSPNRSGAESSGEGHFGRGNDDPDSPQLAEQALVPITATSASRGPSTTPTVPRLTNATERDIIPCQPGGLVPGSLDDKRRFLTDAGLSEGVAKTLLAARSNSTYAAYESGWRHFSRWCQRKAYDPFTSSVEKVLRFLQHCLKRKKLAHSTIRNRVYAIALYHRTLPLEKLSQHIWIKGFLRGAKRECPRLRDTLPKWSLQLVLQSLRGRPFEPLDRIGLGWLSWKTAFIIGVTTARRIGEVQALSVSDRFLQLHPDGVRLKLNPFFIPKVNSDQNRESEIFMTPFCPPTDPNSRNTLHCVCPCRVIRLYMERTAAFRRTDQFFVCYEGAKKGQAAHKMTIARWMRRCIEEAYRATGRDPPTGLKAHSVRATAATWAQFNQTSMADICKTATWSSGCTFATHYQLNLAGNVSTARFAANVLQTVLDRRPN